MMFARWIVMAFRNMACQNLSDNDGFGFMLIFAVGGAAGHMLNNRRGCGRCRKTGPEES